MRIQWQPRRLSARILAVALAAFGIGCGTIRGPRDAGLMPQESPPLTLDTTQEQRAESMAHFAAGVSAEIKDGFEASLPEYRRSLELDPGNALLAARIGQIYLNRRDPTNAVAVLEQATQANPTSPDAWFLLGYAHRASDQVPKALAAFRQALKVDPKHLPTIRVLVDIYVQQNSTAELSALVTQLVNQPSKDPSYWTGVGDVLVAAIHAKPSLASLILGSISSNATLSPLTAISIC